MLMNYKSCVPASTSINYIEQKLVAHGATNIIKRYSADKKLEAILFQIDRGGMLVPILLPARIDAVEKTLKKAVRRPRPGTMEKIREQASRTAWKIISDWVDAQFAMIQLEQTELLEVFLPFVWSQEKEQTFFEVVKGGNYKLLGSGKD